jgi:hypothetical protein
MNLTRCVFSGDNEEWSADTPVRLFIFAASPTLE